MDIVLIDIETTGLDPRAEGAAILEIAAARLWAALEARVTAQGDATFFHSTTIPGEGRDRAHAEAVRQWSLTSRGGRQMDLTRLIDAPACSSVYGLCE